MEAFIVDYDNKTLILYFERWVYRFNLNEGDIGDFWGSFTDKQDNVRDINFYQEDENQPPSVSIYDVEDDHVVSGSEVYVNKFLSLGDPVKYHNGGDTIERMNTFTIYNATFKGEQYEVQYDDNDKVITNVFPANPEVKPSKELYTFLHKTILPF